MITTFFPPYNFGGDGIQISWLVNALATRGHEVHVIHNLDAYMMLSQHMPDVSQTNYHPNVTVHSLSSGQLSSLDLIASHQLGRPALKSRQLTAILKQHNFDVIHFHNISLMGGVGILAYGDGVKLCTMHDHWFVCETHVLWRFNREPCQERACVRCAVHHRRPPQLWRSTKLTERMCRHIDTFMVPSESARENHLRNGFPADIFVCPYFIPARITDNKEMYAAERPYFLFAGRLIKLKGVQTLIEAFKRYHKADLLITGVGPYEAELQRQALGASHIQFLGHVSHDELAKLYRGAVATIVPSIGYETFGLVVLESLIHKTPAIVHDFGALPEVIKDGGGILYRSQAELIEAMETLRTQPDLRRHMGSEGYANYQRNYTEEQHIDRYLTIIDSIEQ